LDGPTAIVWSTAAVTVIVVVPIIPFIAAVTVDEPIETAVANPPLVMVAAARLPDIHVTVVVRFCVELSE
jgi:hypothetical protein